MTSPNSKNTHRDQRAVSLPIDLSPREAAQDNSFEDELSENTVELVAALAETRRRLLEEVGQVIVGQSDVLDQVLTALFAKGHCVMTGVPGLAKTLMVSSLAKTLSLEFKRIQFTPDLMPTDITGTMVLAEGGHGHRSFAFQSGPIFTNMLLADEINRTPPKTQAALLEGMQERRVTVGGVTHPLPEPFLVLATQNPIEQEGTYTLPEAQLDRFLFMINVDYPSLSEEQEILIKTTLDSISPPGGPADQRTDYAVSELGSACAGESLCGELCRSSCSCDSSGRLPRP